MEYGRLKPTPSARFVEQISSHQNHTRNPKNILKKYARVLVFSSLATLLLATIVAIIVVIQLQHHKHSSPTKPNDDSSSNSNSTDSNPDPSTPSYSGSLTRMCQSTRYPDLCVTTLSHYIHKNKEQGNESDDEIGYGKAHGIIVEMSLNMTLERLRSTLDHLQGYDDDDHHQGKESFQRSANDDCVELLEDSVDLLTRARGPLLVLISSTDSTTNLDDHQRYSEIRSYKTNVMTWMTTICTNQDTCTEGFEQAGGAANATAQILQDLSKIISIHQGLTNTVLNDVVVPRRQLMGLHTFMGHKSGGSPRWMSSKNIELLNTPLSQIRANITVSKDRIGPEATVTTIRKAIKMAPNHSVTPFIIRVKAGRYEESNLKVIKGKTNLWFIGDGKGKTIITGHTSVKAHNVTTMNTATFGAIGDGFVARGITFENTAGPENCQAVALLVKSNQAVVYDCEMKGYQDTLYVHSNNQFYRNCDIYGTVDFIFGNAIAVFQYCTIYTLKPNKKQSLLTITAQKRSSTCPDTCTGMSIHRSQIRAAPDLEPLKSNYSTYLGRPWDKLSTVVYMLSFIDDHVDPRGWTPWRLNSTMDDVFYGEYMNYGPGSNTSMRMKSRGIHPNLSTVEAMRFTVDEFLDGSSWISSAMVPFVGGL